MRTTHFLNNLHHSQKIGKAKMCSSLGTSKQNDLNMIKFGLDHLSLRELKLIFSSNYLTEVLQILLRINILMYYVSAETPMDDTRGFYSTEVWNH